jgi:hypothetical protein
VTPERLEEIRKATGKYPRVWDGNGRYVMPPKYVHSAGPIAIEHRRELLEYVDELLSGCCSKLTF